MKLGTIFKLLDNNLERDYIAKTINVSQNAADELRRLREKQEPDAKTTLLESSDFLFEYLTVYLNITDRAAYQVLGRDKSHELSNRLAPPIILYAVENMFKNHPDKTVEKIKADCWELFTQRFDAYVHFKMAKTEEDSTSGWVPWEFAKVINDHIGQPDIRWIMVAQNIFFFGLKKFDPMAFVKSLK